MAFDQYSFDHSVELLAVREAISRFRHRLRNSPGKEPLKVDALDLKLVCDAAAAFAKVCDITRSHGDENEI